MGERGGSKKTKATEVNVRSAIYSVDVNIGWGIKEGVGWWVGEEGKSGGKRGEGRGRGRRRRKRKGGGGRGRKRGVVGL
jgi:hypothetical protein